MERQPRKASIRAKANIKVCVKRGNLRMNVSHQYPAENDQPTANSDKSQQVEGNPHQLGEEKKKQESKENKRAPLNRNLQIENLQQAKSCRTRKENEEQLRLQTDKGQKEQERQAKIRQGEAEKAKAAPTTGKPANQVPTCSVVLKQLTTKEIEAWVGPSRHQDKKERQGEAEKAKAAPTTGNPANQVPTCSVVLKQLTTKEIEAWSGRHKDKTTRQGEAEKAEASATAAVPVAGPSSLNTTVSLPSSPELLATKKGKKLPNPDNYDISDLRSDDSTDEATRPKKSIPTWARSVNLKVALNEQANEDIDTESLFPAEVFLREPDLNELFEIECDRCADRMNKRTSSAYWESPPSNYM